MQQITTLTRPAFEHFSAMIGQEDEASLTASRGDFFAISSDEIPENHAVGILLHSGKLYVLPMVIDGGEPRRLFLHPDHSALARAVAAEKAENKRKRNGEDD